MAHPKVGQRFEIPKAPFLVYFEIVTIPGINSDFGGDLIIPILPNVLSVSINHANCEEIVMTISRRGDGRIETLRWKANVGNIKEFNEDWGDDFLPTVDYDYVRLEFSTK